MENDKFITILIPCYNEEEAIQGVIKNVDRTMNQTNYQYEILIVDDNSTDKSVELIKQEMRLNNKVRLFERKINKGSGASRKSGIREARGDIVVMLDGDGTYNYEDIPKMLSYFPEYDQVNGARTTEEGTYKLLRFSAKWFIRKLAIYLSGYQIPDLNTGLKAFKKDMMMKYLWVIPNGFSCVTTMTMAFLTNGYNVKYIPTKYFKRVGNSKFHPVKDTLRYLNTVIRMIIYFNPLKFFIPLSLILFFIAIGWIIYSLSFIDFKIHASQVILIIFSLQIFIFGFLADLIVSTTKREK